MGDWGKGIGTDDRKHSFASSAWPRHRGGGEVQFGDILVTEEFGKVPVQTITFSRDSVYVGDSCGHGLTLPLGAVID